MTEGNSDWVDDIVHGWKSLTADEAPALEIVLLDAVVDWLYSAGNPGEGYSEEHAGHLVSTLFSAVESARKVQPTQQPAITDDIATARARVVDGAHELADKGADGVSLIVSRLMPSMLAELADNTGERGKQAHGVFVYLLYALAVGTREEQDPAVMAGLSAAFAGWDEVLRAGYTLPWRRPPGSGAGSLTPPG